MKMTNLPELPESELISWRLRQPAPRLKRRIFRETVILPSLTWFWGALAPATACVVLTLVTFNSSSTINERKPMIAMAFSNQNSAAYGFDEELAAQNHWANVTFDWTNHSVFNSSISFTPTTNLSN